MKKKKSKEQSTLVTALEFVSLAQRDKGASYQTHCVIRDRTVVAYDGVIAAGHIIDEDIVACPHTHTLLSALKQCSSVLSITQLPTQRLSVKSGNFKAFVPCVTVEEVTPQVPDGYCGQMDNSIRIGLETVSPIVAENSQRVVLASACIRSGSILATNGHVLLEYWHGIHLPPDMLVPKLFINVITRIKKDIVGFGYSESSLTIYFDDNSWVKTQLYKDQWPSFGDIMSKPHSANELPNGLREAIDVIDKFVQDDSRIFIGNNEIRTSSDDTTGAVYTLDGLTDTAILNVRHLRLLLPLIKTMDITGNKGISYFYGDNIRGAITQSK